MAVRHILMEQPPDLVLSGVNHGSNFNGGCVIDTGGGDSITLYGVSLDQVLAREDGLDEAVLMEQSAGDTRVEGGVGEAEGEPLMDDAMAMQKRMQERDLGGMKRVLDGKLYWPRINLAARCREAGAPTDRQIVELFCGELLAAPAGAAATPHTKPRKAAPRTAPVSAGGAAFQPTPNPHNPMQDEAFLTTSTTTSPT